MTSHNFYIEAKPLSRASIGYVAIKTGVDSGYGLV